MPSTIKHLKFNARELVITLEEEDIYGSQVVRMYLSEEIISGRGLFSSFAGGQIFTNKQCKLEEVNAIQKTNWRINCQ
ncbi:hypothetical protein [Mycoplasma ovis]|nr:hypothetical protein [Mycoplasma ovis]